MIKILVRTVAVASVGVVALATSGCDQVVPQQVVVNVSAWKEAPQVLRLHEGTECKGPYKEQMRSTDLMFTFDTDSIRGGLGVVTQELGLCYKVLSTWVPLWASRHGGGAIRVVVRCENAALCTDELLYR